MKRLSQYFFTILICLSFSTQSYAYGGSGGTIAPSGDDCMDGAKPHVDKKAAKSGGDESAKKKYGEKAEKMCGKFGDTNDAAQQTSSDGMGSLMPALLGAGLGALAGMMAAKKAGKDAEKKIKEEAEKAKKEVDEKIAKLREEQEEKVKEFEDKIADLEDKAKQGAGSSKAPNIGPQGIAAEIKAAFDAGDYNKVRSIIEDPQKRPFLPDAYVEDVLKQVAKAEGLGGTAAGIAQNETESLNDYQGSNIPVAAVSLSGDRGPASLPSLPVSASELMEAGMVDRAREEVRNLISDGRVREAADYVAKLARSADSQFVALAQEMRQVLDQKLEELGLPAGDLGLGLLSNNN